MRISGRLKRTAERAAVSETRYRAIFDRAASGIMLFDPNSRRVLDANPQAQRLVGASLDELRRRDVATIFDTPVSLAPGSERDEPSAEPSGADHPRRRRAPRRGILDRRPRSRHGPRARHAAAGHLASPRSRAPRAGTPAVAAAPRHARRAHGPAESHLPQRRAAAPHRRSRAPRRFAVDPLHRLRQLQEHQRFARPLDRRRLSAFGRAPAARFHRQPGPRGAHGRRRIPRGHAPLRPRPGQRRHCRTRGRGAQEARAPRRGHLLRHHQHRHVACIRATPPR